MSKLPVPRPRRSRLMAPRREGPARRQSRASPRRRPVGRRDHRTEHLLSLGGVYAQSHATRATRGPAFIRRQVCSMRSSAPCCSPPAGLATPSARTSSSRSARTPCFPSGAGTRTRRREPVRGPALTPREVSRAESQETSNSPPISGVSASPTARVAGGVGQRACSAAVARVVDVLAGGPIRGGLQAHDAVGPLAEQPSGADARVAAAERRISPHW